MDIVSIVNHRDGSRTILVRDGGQQEWDQKRIKVDKNWNLLSKRIHCRLFSRHNTEGGMYYFLSACRDGVLENQIIRLAREEVDR